MLFRWSVLEKSPFSGLPRWVTEYVDQRWSTRNFKASKAKKKKKKEFANVPHGEVSSYLVSWLASLKFEWWFRVIHGQIARLFDTQRKMCEWSEKKGNPSGLVLCTPTLCISTSQTILLSTTLTSQRLLNYEQLAAIFVRQPFWADRPAAASGRRASAFPSLKMASFLPRPWPDLKGQRLPGWNVVVPVLLLILMQPSIPQARTELNAGNPDAKRLYDDLLSNYNKLVRPVVNTTDPLTVRIKLKLSQLIDVVSPISPQSFKRFPSQEARMPFNYIRQTPLWGFKLALCLFVTRDYSHLRTNFSSLASPRPKQSPLHCSFIIIRTKSSCKSHSVLYLSPFKAFPSAELFFLFL